MDTIIKIRSVVNLIQAFNRLRRIVESVIYATIKILNILVTFYFCRNLSENEQNATE